MQYCFDTESFVKQIKTKRFVEENIDLRTMAKKTRISAATISRVENGKMPDWETFFKLCHWLNIQPQSFFKIKSKKKL